MVSSLHHSAESLARSTEQRADARLPDAQGLAKLPIAAALVAKQQERALTRGECIQGGSHGSASLFGEQVRIRSLLGALRRLGAGISPKQPLSPRDTSVFVPEQIVGHRHQPGPEFFREPTAMIQPDEGLLCNVGGERRVS
jgi:hypothetical protein